MMLSMAAEMIGFTYLLKKSESPRNSSHTLSTMSRTLSNFKYARARMATRATMAATTRPMGFSIMATLRADCAAVAAMVSAV